MGDNVGACDSHVQGKEAEQEQSKKLYQDLTQRSWASRVRDKIIFIFLSSFFLQILQVH